VRKAQQLDDSLGEVHAALGSVKALKWDSEGALKEWKRAIELSPQDVLARRFYSNNLRLTGRWEEAIQQGKRARELDPLSAETSKALGATYFWAGRYDEAIDQYKKTLEIDPNSPSVHDLLADAFARKGLHREAIAEEQRYLVLSDDEDAAEELGRDFATAGYARAMRALYRKTLVFIEEAAKHAYVSPMNFAVLHAQLGEIDEAFRWLERAYVERQPWLRTIHADPQFEPLRSDPRFAELVRRVREAGARAS